MWVHDVFQVFYLFFIYFYLFGLFDYRCGLSHRKDYIAPLLKKADNFNIQIYINFFQNCQNIGVNEMNSFSASENEMP